MSRRRTLAVIVCMTLWGVGGDRADADSAACVAGDFRAGSRNAVGLTDTDFNGVSGVVEVPHVAEFRNVDTGSEVSAGDLYGRYGNDFVQFGFAYGWTPRGFSPTIHPFLGEWTGPNAGDELLTFDYSRALTPGTHYLFELRRDENPASASYLLWFGFVDGVAVLKSTYDHEIGYAATNGEVNWRCHGMANSVTERRPDGSPAATLRYRRRSTGAWYGWGTQADVSTDATCFAATRYVAATAWDHNTWASSCPQS